MGQLPVLLVKVLQETTEEDDGSIKQKCDQLIAQLEIQAPVSDLYRYEIRLRSCLDHLYALTTVIRNRKLLKLDTFCAFIYFEKAFDGMEYRFLWFKCLPVEYIGKCLKKTVLCTWFSFCFISDMKNRWQIMKKNFDHDDVISNVTCRLWILPFTFKFRRRWLWEQVLGPISRKRKRIS